MKLTVGGDILTFDIPVSAPTSNITTSKLHWGSVILTPGSRYLVFDVKNFYLNNVISKHEFYKIDISLIPQELIYEYDIMEKKINGFLYDGVEKGLCGLVQAGTFAHTALKEHIRIPVESYDDST